MVTDAPAAGRGHAVAGALRVLVADDSAAVRRLLRIVLEETAGFSLVGEAADGAEAVMLAQREKPDVVLLDVAMPHMDGLEAISEIRQHAPHTKIIVLSAYSSSRMGREALVAGADAYVEKASSDEALLSTIRGLFPDADALSRFPLLPDSVPAPFAAAGVPATGVVAAADADEDLFRTSLLDALDEGVVVVDDSGVVRSANFMATVILGVPTSRLVGSSLLGLGLSTLAEEATLESVDAAERITAALASGRPQSGMTVGLTRDGKVVRWLLVSVRPLLRSGEEQAKSAIVSLVDITDRQRSTVKFRGLLEAAPDAIVAVDATGAIALVNAQAERLFGYSREELIGQQVEILVPEKVRPVHPAHRAQYFAHPHTGLIRGDRQLMARRRDGTEFPADISLGAIETEVGVLVSAAVRDVTEHVRAIERLEAVRSQLEAAQRLAHVGSWEVDLATGEVTWSAELCRIHGVDPALPTRQVQEVVSRVHEEDRSAVARITLGQLVTVDTPSLEYRVVRTDGTVRVCVTLAEAVTDHYGSIVGLRGTTQDVTELRESEARFYAVIEAIPAGVIVLSAIRDGKGRIVDFRFEHTNRIARDYAGRALHEIVGRRMLEIYPVSERVGILDDYRKVVETGEPLVRPPQSYNWTVVGGKEERIFDLRVSRMGDGCVVTYFDITSAHRSAALLEERDKRLRAAIDAIPVGVIIASAIRDEAGRIVDFRFDQANRAAVDVAGRPIVDFIGRRALEIYPTLAESGILDPVISVVESGQSVDLPAQPFEHLVDGRPQWGLFEIRVNRLNDGCIATFANVTDRELSASAVRHSEQRFHRAVDTMLDSVVIASAVRDDSGRVVDFRFDYANTSVTGIDSWRREQIVGRRLLELYPAISSSDVFGYLVHLVETGEPVRARALPFRAMIEGREVERFINIKATRFEDGFIVTWHDVTEQTRAHADLQRANENLQAANAELRTFAYGAAHDIAEPLRVIAGFADVLSRSSTERLDSRERECLAYILDAAHRGQALVDDLFEFARVRSAEVVVTDVEVGALIARSVEDLSPRIAETGGLVTVGAMPTLRTDAERLARVFRNLLSNALKFVDAQRQPRVEVSAERLERGWQFAVGDNGIGIPPEARARIFGMFQRLHSRDAYPGTGMGLAICRTIVETSGGRLWVEESAGGGSVFYFTVPDPDPAS